jgi:hypothetical protein
VLREYRLNRDNNLIQSVIERDDFVQEMNVRVDRRKSSLVYDGV